MKINFTEKGALWGILCIFVFCGFCFSNRWERAIPSPSYSLSDIPAKRECIFSPHENTIYLENDFHTGGTKNIYIINEYGVVTDSIRRDFSIIHGLTFTEDSTSILICGIDTVTAELFISQYSLSGYLIRERRLYTPDDWHIPLSVCHSTDGHIYATGYHRTPHDIHWRNQRMFLLKMDTLGNILKLKVFDNPDFCEGGIIRCTPEGNLIIAGLYGYYPDPYLVKADTNCDTIWTRTYSAWLFYDIEDIAVTSDGGYILAASSIVRLDSLGNILWTFDTVSLGFGALFCSVYETEEGSYVFAGRGLRGMLNSEGECLWIALDDDFSMIWKCIDFSGDIFYYTKNSYSDELLTKIMVTDTLGCVVNHDYRIKRGWNLISSPLEEELWIYAGFPYVRASDCHYYNSREYRYYNSYGITYGKGYWLFSTVDSTSHIEATIGTMPDLSATLYPGWNLVGTGTIPIPKEWLDTIPSVIMPIFGYDPDSGGYYSADTLYYGNGYWILSRDSIEVNLP